MGFNAAGLFCKLESFKRNISIFMPGVIFVQETKARQKNKLKIENYSIFEQIRANNAGGGLLIAIHNSFEPVCILEDNANEILIVEANLQGQKVRFITAGKCSC